MDDGKDRNMSLPEYSYTRNLILYTRQTIQKNSGGGETIMNFRRLLVGLAPTS